MTTLIKTIINFCTIFKARKCTLKCFSPSKIKNFLRRPPATDIFSHLKLAEITCLFWILVLYGIYLRCCEIPKGYSSNSSNISDYVSTPMLVITSNVEITSTQHYIVLA